MLNPPQYERKPRKKSDKQKNGATKTARTGWWLVSAGSPLFTSLAGGVSASCPCWSSVVLEVHVFVSFDIAINAVESKEYESGPTG